MENFISKRDLEDRIAGIEQYRPGDPSAKDLLLSMTSGSTGLPTLLVKDIRAEKRRRWGDPPAMAFFMPNHGRALTLALKTLFDGTPIERAMFLSKHDLLHPECARLLADFSPRKISSLPSLLALFIERTRPELLQNALKSVTDIFFGSELLTPLQDVRIRRVMPKADFHFDYVAAEVGNIGTSCPIITEKYFEAGVRCPVHLRRGIRVAIHEPDEEGIGDVILTNSQFSGYRIGDRGKLIQEECPCGGEGSHSVLLVHGRADFDIVHTVGATILASEIDKALLPLERMVRDYFVEVEERDVAGRTLPRLLCYVAAAEDVPQGLSQTIARALSGMFVTKTRTLGELIEKGAFLDSVIEIVDALPHMKKKRRLRKVSASTR